MGRKNSDINSSTQVIHSLRWWVLEERIETHVCVLNMQLKPGVDSRSLAYKPGNQLES